MSTKLDHICHPAGSDRVVTNEHLRDCNASGCPGCLPCRPEHGHCHRCRRTHLDASHPRVCPSCVGHVRQDILGLVDDTVDAHRELVHRSVGSVAFMVNAPAGDYEAHSYLHHSATAGRLCKCAHRGMVCPSTIPPHSGPVCDRPCTHPTCYRIRHPKGCPDRSFVLDEGPVDERHPLTVLAAWELTWRRALDHDRPADDDGDERPVTLATTSGYLLTNLGYMAQQPPEVSDFDQFAKELAAARTWLTDVLRLGYKPDRAGICPMCGKDQLVKDWDDEDEGTRYDEARDGKRYADLWYCPNPDCGQTWTEEQYRNRVDGLYVGLADRLNITALAVRIRVPEGTLRRWAASTTKVTDPGRLNAQGIRVGIRKATVPPRLRSAGTDATGRKVYRVTDAEALRDNHGRAVS